MNKLKNRTIVLCLPILIGFAIFYLFPFGKTLYYSFIENTHTQKFVWLDNYISLLKNKYFLLALKNTTLFTVVSVFAVMLMSILIAYLLEENPFFRKFFIIPMLLPTTAVVFVWDIFFDTNEYVLLRKGEFGGLFTLLPLYLLFIWKNTGFSVIIISSALSGITPEIKEAASLDGAGKLRIYMSISLPYVSGELYFATVLAFISSLKIYRETSLLYEPDYPPDEVYMLQNFIYNHFQKLNYQTLTCATVIFVGVIAFIAVFVFNKLEKRDDIP